MGNMQLIHRTYYQDSKYKNGPTLIPVGIALLVMTLSLVVIAIVYLAYGHILGYASKVLEQQQKRLRRQYGLPTGNIVTDPIVLQIPPSLRDMPSEYYNNPL
jgi:hypothetical protein